MKRLLPIAYVFAGIWIAGVCFKAACLYLADPDA